MSVLVDIYFSWHTGIKVAVRGGSEYRPEPVNIGGKKKAAVDAAFTTITTEVLTSFRDNRILLLHRHNRDFAGTVRGQMHPD